MLLDESENLMIEHIFNSSQDGELEDQDRYFNKDVLQNDLRAHEEWKTEAESVLSLLEDDEIAI